MSLREVEREAWDALLDRLGLVDAYLRRGFVDASCVLDEGHPTLLHDGHRTVFACSVREIPESDRLDVMTPYGCGGPVSADGDASAFWPAYEDWCAEHGVVSTFVRFHPLYGNHRGAGEFVRLERLADTVAWPIGGTGDPTQTLRRNLRRDVRRAAREVEVVLRRGGDRLDSFARLYERGMRRLGAASFYLFPGAYWEALAGALNSSLLQLDAYVAGELVAGTLCLATPPWLHYHLAVSLEPGRAAGAGHLLLVEAARWGQQNGCEVFHLGGGVGGSRDSLWEYKRRFAPDGLVEAWIGKAVHDERAYLRLSGTESVELGGFFPAYRAP